MAETTTGPRPVSCLGGILAVLALCIGIAIFASVFEQCDCDTATALRSSTVECYVAGWIHSRNRPYDEVCIAPGTTTTIVDSSALLTEEPVLTDEPIVTEEPTEPPTEPPAAVMPSIMGGQVSYCAVRNDQKYLNLPLNSGADPAEIQSKLDSGDLTVQVGDTPGRCIVEAGYNLLVCAFPAAAFPNFSSTAPNSIINVLDRGTIIDVIQFDNTCEAEQQPSSGGDDDGQTTCDPNQPGTPCFCALNPDTEVCQEDW